MSIRQDRLRDVARRHTMRALSKAGVLRARSHLHGAYDVTGLPLNGRLRVSGARTSEGRAEAARMVRESYVNDGWTALVLPVYGEHTATSLTVHVGIEDFARLLGRLAHSERLLDGRLHEQGCPWIKNCYYRQAKEELSDAAAAGNGRDAG